MTKTPRCEGAEQGEHSEKSSLVNAAPDNRQCQAVDPRAAWLLRASARYQLVREGAMTLSEGLSNQFICDLFDAIPAPVPATIK